MAHTITRVPDGDDVWGRNKIQIRDVVVTTYVAGGIVINASDVGLKFFRSVSVVGGDAGLLTYYPYFDLGTTPAGSVPITGKLRASTATGTEVVAGALSPNLMVRLQFIGG